MYKITQIKKKRKESKDEVNSLKMPKHLPTPCKLTETTGNGDPGPCLLYACSNRTRLLEARRLGKEEVRLHRYQVSGVHSPEDLWGDRRSDCASPGHQIGSH